MKDNPPCSVCAYPSKYEHSFLNIPGLKDAYYCSKDCKDSERKELHFFAGIVFVLGIFWNLFFLIGFGIFIIAEYDIRMHRGKVRLRIEVRNELNFSETRDTWPDTKIRSTKSNIEIIALVYSNILLNDVLPCCHQSARLNDKYCTCGRVIDYPKY